MLDAILDDLLDLLLLELHLGQDVLEDGVDDVAEDERVVDVALDALVLLGEVCLARTWERLDDLGGRDQNVRLNDHHGGLLAVIGTILGIIVDPQVEVVLLAEVPNDAHEVARLDPELDGPAASQRHLEEDRTLDEAVQNWLPVLVHWRTEF